MPSIAENVTEEKSNRFKLVEESQKLHQTKEETMNYYKEWVKTYEEDLEIVGYQAPQLAADYLAKQGLPKDIKILDVACGTGLVSSILCKQHGYTNLDGLDGSQDMINAAQSRNLYTNYFCTFIGDGCTIPIADDTYDAGLMAGGLVPGHIKLDAFLEMIRVVKPGGFIINTMREENRRKCEEYQKIDELFEEWEKQGLWERVEVAITKDYYMGLDGLVFVFKVKKLKH